MGDFCQVGRAVRYVHVFCLRVHYAHTQHNGVAGPIIHLAVFNKSIIILNDPSYATDMLDKKSRLYSDRPTLMMAGRLIGWDDVVGLVPFSERWIEHRKMLAQFMGTKVKVEGFSDVLTEETGMYLRRILEGKVEWVDHSRKWV